MANNTEQDKMDILIRELYTLSAQDIEPHHFAVKARQLIEAEATRARIDELENRLKVQFIRSHWERLCSETNSWAKYVDRRIAELKRQAEGGK